MHRFYRPMVCDYFAHAGIMVNGPRPFDLQVRDNRAYARMACGGSLGFGECFVDGSVQTRDKVGLIRRVLTADTRDTFMPIELILDLKEKCTNQQTKARARRVGAMHYDITPELYKNMLGKYMAYTCGYWEDGAKNLDEAQEDKFRLVCEKMQLRPGMKVLDIGCGYGTLAKFMAEHYGVEVVGITISKGQLKMGQELCAHLPSVALRFLD